MWTVRAGVALVVAGLLLGGCRGRVPTERERADARAVVAVVERNMMASERGDAHAYCADFTGRYLKERFKGGVAACERRFRRAPARLVGSPEARYLSAVTQVGSRVDAAVHYKLGKVRGLDYIMKLDRPPAGGPGRWLIDNRIPPEE